MEQAASFYTQTFDLDERVKWLDLQCIEVAERQERSAKARKQLTEETKQTKKSAAALGDNAAAVTEAFSKLLKTYQAEIDSLGKRAKISEAALSELYRALYQAPNPGPFLAQALVQEQALLKQKSETSSLQVELAEYEAEFAQLKNQDITIRELTDQVAKLEAELEAKEREHAEAREMMREQLMEDLDSKRELEELRLRLAQAERDCEEQRRVCDAARNELFEYKFQSEERDQSRQRELDQLQEELLFNKPNAVLLSSSENEIARLRQLDLKEEERERARREEEISRLYQALDQQKLETGKLRALEVKLEREMEEAKQRFADAAARDRARIAELESQLESKSAHTLLAAEVALADNRLEEENRARLASSLETVNAQLRLALSEKETALAQLREGALSLEEQLEDAKTQLRQLQDRVDTGESPRNANSHQRLLHHVAPHSPIPGGEASSELGVIGILQEQRDRFRRRMLELEQELETSATKEKRAKEQVERLNARLAQQQQRNHGASTDFHPMMLAANQRKAPASASAAAGSRSPLALTLRFFSANSQARAFFAIYLALLHTLVFFSLTQLTK